MKSSIDLQGSSANEQVNNESINEFSSLGRILEDLEDQAINQVENEIAQRSYLPSERADIDYPF
tara:strand:+ start:293 stop:484 length:192 start_codon:yes stop_codon:yes gene_type:complete